MPMRYFFYTVPNRNKQCVISLDEEMLMVKMIPAICYPLSAAKVLQLRKDQRHLPDARMFEICENQFKKYRDSGIKPTNFDWD